MEEEEKIEIKSSENINIEEILMQKELIRIYKKGAKSRYLVKKCFIPNDTQHQFFLLKNLISDLKDLLFKDIDSKNINEINRINEIYNIADIALKINICKISESPEYVEIGNTKFPIIKLKADDAGSVECFREDIKETREAFIKQQYNSHIPELESALNAIEKELANRRIIPIDKPDIEDIRDIRIEKNLNKNLGVKI